jgi:predicted AAA+ superfamily ATPase
MYIKRALEQRVLTLLNHFPAVAILGSRQVGKTTLVQELTNYIESGTVYLDLENPADANALAHPLEFLRTVQGKTIIIDEIQRNPELFPVLRSAIDAHRKNGRFILLGSASKDLLFLSNETLAGRIIYLELPTFFIGEIGSIFDFRIHWLRGGYPVALTQPDGAIRSAWLRSFISTYTERDLRMLGLGAASNDVQRLLYMLASMHGNLINTNNLSNSIGLNNMITRNILSFFEKSFLIRLLLPWYANIGKRLIKSPKIFFRDSGIINHLLGIVSYEEMLRHPMLGNLWEGYVIENIINSLGEEFQYYFYRTADGAECDLAIFQGITCWAVIDAKFSPSPKQTKSMTIVKQDLKPEKAFFVIPECAVPYTIGNNTFVATLEQTLLLLKG